jgi:hypothetical protein
MNRLRKPDLFLYFISIVLSRFLQCIKKQDYAGRNEERMLLLR